MTENVVQVARPSGASASLRAARIAEIQREHAAEIERLKAEHQREMDEFKQRVASTAKRYAVEHDWCGVVKNALAEMDVPWIDSRYRWRVAVVFNVSAERADGGGEPSEDFIRSSMQWDEDDEMPLSIDEDWEDARIEFHEFEVLSGSVEADR